ncbi:MAG TPA: DUF2911 domain-containing protein [Gemmatimonadaceae bacterium]|nr:DUF2911 domain-containing protein [Gemmatimonadaceae bacterium]
MWWRPVPCLVAALALVAAGSSACAQTNYKSQLGTVSQQVMDTRIAVRYRRPVARGRDLFGALVPWGRIWTPSADSAAVLTASSPITVNGERLPAGSYGIWAIPDSASWTIIFSGKPAAFHLRYPEGQDVLRVQAKPVKGEYVETLLFDFPMVDADSARLELRWGEVTVPLVLRTGAEGSR